MNGEVYYLSFSICFDKFRLSTAIDSIGDWRDVDKVWLIIYILVCSYEWRRRAVMKVDSDWSPSGRGVHVILFVCSVIFQCGAHITYIEPRNPLRVKLNLQPFPQVAAAFFLIFCRVLICDCSNDDLQGECPMSFHLNSRPLPIDSRARPRLRVRRGLCHRLTWQRRNSSNFDPTPSSLSGKNEIATSSTRWGFRRYFRRSLKAVAWCIRHCLIAFSLAKLAKHFEGLCTFLSCTAYG